MVLVYGVQAKPNMDISEEIIAQERYKEFFQRFRGQTLKRVLNDRSTALECAKRGIQVVEPDKLTDQYMESVADLMQKVAKVILEKRTKS
jgi:hypothetical protein